MKQLNRTFRLGISAALAFLFMILSAFPAQAAVSLWSAETILDPSYMAYLTPHVAVNAAGTSAVVWDQWDPNTFISQVAVSVRTRAGWQGTTILSDPTVDSVNLGAVVTPTGRVMVFWASAGVVNYALFNGKTWSVGQPVPGDTGYNYFAGAGVDRMGNIQVALGFQQPSNPATFLVETVVMNSQGIWQPPTLVTTINPMGYPRLIMNSTGNALLLGGTSSYYSSKPGVWGAEKPITLIGGQVYTTDAALDTSGKAYFIYRTRYNGFYLSTSTSTTAWTTPQQVPQFDTLGSDIHIVGSSSGHALVYGTDYTTGELNASVTTNGGGGWSAPISLGLIYNTPLGVSSSNGMYAITWNDGMDMKVAVGTGAGTPMRAWSVKTLATNYAEGSVALNGNQAVSAWWRATDLYYTSLVIGVSTGKVGP